MGEGDKVFSRFTWHGTHRGEFFGVPATGKQITVKGMVVDRVVAGKMAESRILMDGLSMMRQLGVIPGLTEQERSASISHPTCATLIHEWEPVEIDPSAF